MGVDTSRIIGEIVMVQVKVVNKSDNALPQYETNSAAGMDVRAYIPTTELQVIKPGGWGLVHTGLYLQIPDGYEVQVRPRSGLALKHGITVLNAPGTIDADYRGEVGVILANFSDKDFKIANGDRIAQLVVAPVARAEWDSVLMLDETERGIGGYGHSGVK